jgi:hypothetical protein
MALIFIIKIPKKIMFILVILKFLLRLKGTKIQIFHPLKNIIILQIKPLYTFLHPNNIEKT